LTALKAVSSARPVMIPGSAIGNSSSSETAFLPKNVLRHSALQQACQVQGNSGRQRGILSDNVTASIISLRPAASLNQRSVSPAAES
jgi:hypothetical protein